MDNYPAFCWHAISDLFFFHIIYCYCTNVMDTGSLSIHEQPFECAIAFQLLLLFDMWCVFEFEYSSFRSFILFSLFFFLLYYVIFFYMRTVLAPIKSAWNNSLFSEYHTDNWYSLSFWYKSTLKPLVLSFFLTGALCWFKCITCCWSDVCSCFSHGLVMVRYIYCWYLSISFWLPNLLTSNFSW